MPVLTGNLKIWTEKGGAFGRLNTFPFTINYEGDKGTIVCPDGKPTTGVRAKNLDLSGEIQVEQIGDRIIFKEKRFQIIISSENEIDYLGKIILSSYMPSIFEDDEVECKIKETG
jgi:hypothetical protein